MKERERLLGLLGSRSFDVAHCDGAGFERGVGKADAPGNAIVFFGDVELVVEMAQVLLYCSLGHEKAVSDLAHRCRLREGPPAHNRAAKLDEDIVFFRRQPWLGAGSFCR